MTTDGGDDDDGPQSSFTFGASSSARARARVKPHYARAHDRKRHDGPMACTARALLHLLRNLDRRAASRFDEAREGTVKWGLLCTVLQPGIVMLLLLVPYAPDRFQQHLIGAAGRLIAHQRAQLIVVVLDNYRLDRYRARHCRPFAQQCGTETEGKASHPPDRLQGRRSDAVLVDEPIEGGLVRPLLFPHVPDRFTRLGVAWAGEDV
uniref:Uncharacterized protein n=1 Tax=Anopheles coluzzii TaxID=1518534 RepID=A0A8W7PYJ5_ANOCL